MKKGVFKIILAFLTACLLFISCLILLSSCLEVVFGNDLIFNVKSTGDIYKMLRRV